MASLDGQSDGQSYGQMDEHVEPHELDREGVKEKSYQIYNSTWLTWLTIITSIFCFKSLFFSSKACFLNDHHVIISKNS